MLECDGSGNIPVMDIVDGVNENSARLDAWSGTVAYKVGSFIYNATDGFYYQAEVENTGSQPAVGNANWQRWSPVNFFETDMTKTVGATGDYLTLNAALLAAGRWISIDGAVLTLEIEDGHVINYPVYETMIAENIIVTYAGAGSLVIDIGSFVPTSNGSAIIRIFNKQITFSEISISITGSMNTSAIEANGFVSIFRGKIAFDDCTINVNITYTNHKGYIFFTESMVSHTDVTISAWNSPYIDECVALRVGGQLWYVEVDANNLNLRSGYDISYNSTYNSYITLLNAVNCTYGTQVSRCANADLQNSNFRKGVSDDNTDIHINKSVVSLTNTIGGCNVSAGEINTDGARF